MEQKNCTQETLQFYSHSSTEVSQQEWLWVKKLCMRPMSKKHPSIVQGGWYKSQRILLIEIEEKETAD